MRIRSKDMAAKIPGAIVLEIDGTTMTNVRARGRAPQHTPGKMNQTERAYAAELAALKVAGVVAWFEFEPVKLRLADRTHYTPDFMVMLADGSIECHEVKGFWEDDARVKIKVAARLYPIRFVALKPRAKRDGGGFAREEFGR